jgi:hypothetical protein
MATLTLAPETRLYRPVAPWWHTAVLIAFFACLTLGGALFQRAATSHPQATGHQPGAATLYFSLILGEWGLVMYVWRGGLRRSRTSLRDVIGGRWQSGRDVLRDLAIGAGLLITWKLLDSGMERLFGSGHAASIAGFLPQHGIESALWVLLSMSAGVCEELVFRGYLQRQFLAWTGSPWIAVLLQSVIFGISHGYQGAMACAKIAAFGALFGLTALWCRSLRPGMMAHATTDILAGLFRI